MTTHKSITFDKEAQNNLPEHVKAKMKADREKAELIKALKEALEYVKEVYDEYRRKSSYECIITIENILKKHEK